MYSFERASFQSRSKRPLIVLGVLLGIFALSTIVLASLYTREKVIEPKDGIDFVVFISKYLA